MDKIAYILGIDDLNIKFNFEKGDPPTFEHGEWIDDGGEDLIEDLEIYINDTEITEIVSEKFKQEVLDLISQYDGRIE